MRIQNKFGALINFWTILSGILGLLSISIIYLIINASIQGRILQNQCENIRRENDALTTMQEEITSRERQLSWNDEQLSTILNVLLSACKTSNAGLGEISVGEKAERDGYYVLPIEVSVKGNYNQIGRFVNTIERKDLRFQFHEVELSVREAQGSGIIAKFEGDFIILDFPSDAPIMENKK